jgi:hypothetical protein
VTHTWIDDDDAKELLKVGGDVNQSKPPTTASCLGASKLLVPRNHGRPSACI